MNVEELLRSSLGEDAKSAHEIVDLHTTAMACGRRRRTTRRIAAASSAALSVAVIATGAVVIATDTGGNGNSVSPADGGQQVVADPWWQTWTPGRHDGPIDQDFIDAIDPGASVTVYAGGTTSDGTEWAMLTDPVDGHKIGWSEGWDGKPSNGDVPPEVDPGLSWSSWSFMSRATSEDETGINQRWEVIVGRPGTTEIDYSPDGGTTWQPIEVHDGIGVFFIDHGYPPAAARVRLADAGGVYATGTPAGAGADSPSGDHGTAEPTASPTGGGPGLATPTPTPTDGSVEPPSEMPTAASS